MSKLGHYKECVVDGRWYMGKCRCSSFECCTCVWKTWVLPKITEEWHLLSISIWCGNLRPPSEQQHGRACSHRACPGPPLGSWPTPLLKGLPHFILVAREWVLSMNKVVQLVPYMFYDVNVWWKGWPRENCELLLWNQSLAMCDVCFGSLSICLAER